MQSTQDLLSVGTGMQNTRDFLFVSTNAMGGIWDNDAGFDGSQGALVIDNGAVVRIGPEMRFIHLPRFESDSRTVLGYANSLLWAAAHSRGALPKAPVGGLLDELRKQIPVEVTRLCAKPGTLAWDRAVSEAGDVPVIAPLKGYWLVEPEIILGLPPPEKLGVYWHPSSGILGDEYGLFILPRMLAAATIVG